jgi:hypothetical protein
MRSFRQFNPIYIRNRSKNETKEGPEKQSKMRRRAEDEDEDEDGPDSVPDERLSEWEELERIVSRGLSLLRSNPGDLVQQSMNR